MSRKARIILYEGTDEALVMQLKLSLPVGILKGLTTIIIADCPDEILTRTNSDDAFEVLEQLIDNITEASRTPMTRSGDYSDGLRDEVVRR